MNKIINKNLIFFGLILSVIFTLNLLPAKADAFYYIGWVNGNYIGCETDLDSNGNFRGCEYRNNYHYINTTQSNSQTNLNSSVSNSSNTNNTTNSTVTKNTTNKTTTVSTAKKTDNNITDNNKSSLAAGLIFGSDGFMPTSLVQWILFLILAILIIILARKLFGIDKKYKERPLKHA